MSARMRTWLAAVRAGIAGGLASALLAWLVGYATSAGDRGVVQAIGMRRSPARRRRR
jgi:hypothetical protein